MESSADSRAALATCRRSRETALAALPDVIPMYHGPGVLRVDFCREVISFAGINRDVLMCMRDFCLDASKAAKTWMAGGQVGPQPPSLWVTKVQKVGFEIGQTDWTYFWHEASDGQNKSVVPAFAACFESLQVLYLVTRSVGAYPRRMDGDSGDSDDQGSYASEDHDDESTQDQQSDSDQGNNTDDSDVSDGNESNAAEDEPDTEEDRKAGGYISGSNVDDYYLWGYAVDEWMQKHHKLFLDENWNVYLQDKFEWLHYTKLEMSQLSLHHELTEEQKTRLSTLHIDIMMHIGPPPLADHQEFI